MAEFTYNRIDPASVTPSSSADYSAQINPTTILRDPRFLNDLRSYYQERGEGQYLQDDELIEKFYSDQTWGMLNTVSALADAGEAMTASEDQKLRMNRIQSVYQQLPNFWQEGGRDTLDALGDGVGAILADPINLIPGVNAYAKATTAARGAAMAGNSALRAGIRAGAGAGARSEAIISGAQEGIVNTANQVRDMQIGARDEFSTGELAGSVAGGAVIGGGVGGLIGAGTGAVASRTGANQAQIAQFLGLSPEQVGRMTTQEIEQMVQQAQGAVGPYRPVEEPTPAAEAETTQTPDAEQPEEVDPVDQEFAGATEKLEAQISAHRERLTRLMADEADPEVIGEAEQRLDAVTRLRGVIDRIKSEQKEIGAQGVTSDIGTLRRRDQRLARLNRDRAALEALVRQTDTLDTEELIQRIEQAEADRIAARAAEDAETVATTAAEQQAGEALDDAVEGDGAEAGTTAPEAGAVEDAPPSPEAAPATPETPEPEVASPEAQAQEDVTIPYRNDAQRDRILRELAKVEMGETELADMISNGRVRLGKNGRLTNQSIAEIDAIVDITKGERELRQAVARPDAPPSDPVADVAPSASEAPAVNAPITDELRGEALFAGLDYRNVAPSKNAKDGRLTKRNIRSAIAKRGEAEPDPYAMTVRNELNEILEMFQGVSDELHDEEMYQAIRLLSQDAGSKADAEDLISLYAHLRRMADAEDEITDAAMKPLTQTEMTKIKRMQRQIMKTQGLSADAAEGVARAKIMAQRAQDTTPVRGTGERIAEAQQLTTAGRNKAGRIQGFLRSGSRISKGSDYTVTGGNQVRPNEFGFEAALIKAKSGTGPDIVPYVLEGSENVMTRSGKQRMNKGSIAFADALTGRSYESMELAMEVRGDKVVKRASPTATPEQRASASVGEQLRGFLETGDAAGFRAALQAIQRNTDATPGTAGASVAQKLPLKRGDHLLIVRSKTDPTDVRMISPRQAKDGKDISAIIGKKGKNADPANWEVKYAPRERFTSNDAELSALFDALPDEANATGRGMRAEAGFATGMGDPILPDEAASAIIEDATVEELNALATFNKIVTNRPTIQDAFMAARRGESVRWAVNVEGHQQIAEQLSTIYKMLDRVAPQGLALDNVSRAKSIESLESVFARYPAEELAHARKVLERMTGDPTVGPRFSDGNMFALRTQVSGDSPATQQITFSSQGADDFQPAIEVFYHEMAHWAYFNILTPKDRAHFWDLTTKYYKTNGRLDKDRLRDAVPTYQGMETTAGRTITGTNTMDSPQEFFANQFATWAMRKDVPAEMRDEGYWQRITKYVKAIYDRYYKGIKIDADLEPMFAKILPPEEAAKFKLGVDSAPTTPAGKHYHKRYVELRMLRSEMEEAIDSDSADGIGNAAAEIVKYLLSVAPKGSTEARPNTGTLAPLKRLYRIIHQRIDDLDEIVAGKPFDYEGLGAEARVAPEWLDMGMQDVADPQAVADLIRDHFYNGYAGQFQPTNGVPKNIKQLEKTSLSSLLEMVETALEGAYKRAESGDMVAETVPNVREGGATPKPRASKTRRDGRKRAERLSGAIERDAQQTAGTPAGKRKRADAKTTKNVDPALAEEIKSKSIPELRQMYLTHRGTASGDQIAIQLVAKERAQPLPQKAVAIPKEMQAMREEEIRTILTDALYDGNTAKIDQAVYELRRRFVNKGRKKQGMPKIEPVFLSNKKSNVIENEKLDNFGVASSDGVPPSARASVRELLSYVTHRDPQVQVAARTMTYRMLNLMGKTVRGTLDETNVMTAGDIARIAGVDPSDVGTAVFADMRAPEFRKLRSDMRRLSIGLTKGDTSPMDVIHEIGHVVVRSGMLEGDELNSVREAYRLSNDATKSRIQAAYGSKYANRIDGLQDDLLAEEWFAESLAEYMAERVARGDILGGAVDGNIGNIKLRNSFDRAIDRMVEYVAYVVNGLVGRNDIKQQFRRLFLFGDMFENAGRTPMANITRSRPAVHPKLAADAARDSLMSSPKSRLNKIRTFVASGISHDPVNDTFIPFYHGTPNGYAFRRNDNPDVIMRVSSGGNYGPGIYLGNNPDVASQVYANRPTTESIRNQIMDLDVADEVKEDMIFDAMELGDIRNLLARKRRQYSELVEGGEADGELLVAMREQMDGLVEDEANILEALGKNGITTDPLVVPTYVRVTNPADFQITSMYDSANDPLIRGIVDYMNMTETLSARAHKNFLDQFDENGILDGRQVYKGLVRMLTDSGRTPRRAQAELNEMLEDLGYDGMLTTHYNTTDVDGADTMANFTTYEGAKTQYQGVVVFNPENVKHIDAEEFDAMDERLFQRADSAVPRGTTGSIVEAIMDNSIRGVEEINPGSLGEAIETQGSNPSFTSALMSMLRGRKLDVKEEQAVRKTGPLGYFQSQSTRMESLGANWLAGWYKEHFPDLHQKFAKKYFPIHHALRALPDADGKVRAWARRASGGVGQSQPDSYNRVVRALRYGRGSRQEKALNAQERSIFTQIQTAFQNELRNMRAAGITVGDRGPNYLPQVWNVDKIQSNRPEFVAKMAEYFKREKAGKGINFTEDEAFDFANGIYETLAGDGADGVYVPIKGGSRNPKFDNVDFSRVIELEKDPHMLKQLENFLEDDLEFLLVKYFEGSSRRMAHVEKMGINSHAFYDYMMAAEQGSDGIVRLLSRNKEFRKDIRAIGESGYPEYGTLVDTIKMPFHNREAEARTFVQDLVNTANTKGAVAARQLLDQIAPRDKNGAIPITYKRRADAIVGALTDYKGKPAGWQSADYEFVENAMRVAMKKPQVGTGAKTLMNTSKALRSFNNVTLLGFTTLTSLGDVVLPIIRSGSFTDWVKGLHKWKTDPEYAQMIHDVGVAMENIVHERMVYMYGAVDNKLSNAFFNATMLTPWTDMNRQIAGATGYETLKTMQRKAFKYADVPVNERPAEYRTAHRFLTRYGLGDYLPGGKKQNVSLNDRNLLQDDEAVRMAIIKFADESIFQPNPNDVPLWAQTPVGALIFQLKSFPLMMTRLGGHVLSEAKQGNLKPLAYFATLGPAFGMATLSAKDVIQMRGGDDEQSPELRRRNLLKVMGYDEKVHGNEDDFLGWYIEGMMVMGGLGLLGDVIHSTVSQVDNGAYGKMRIASTFLGPSFGTAMASVDVAAGIMDTNDSNAKERTGTRELATRIPVLGGVRALRENIVDAVAGEQSDRSNSDNPWASSNSWTKSFDSNWE
jgi:hypothetical protein